MSLSPVHKGILYAIFSAVLYGLPAYFGVSIIKEGPSSISNMLFWRFFVAMLIFLIVSVFLKNEIFTKKQGFYTLGSSILYGASAAFYFMASKHMGTGLSMVVFFTYPTIVAILNWYLKGHAGTFLYYGISFAITGFGIFLLNDKAHGTFNIVGFFFAFLSALSYAFYVVISKKEVKNISPILSSLFIMGGCAILFLILSVWNHSFFIPETLLIWTHISGMSLVATVVPLFLLLISLRYISSTEVSVLSAITPLVTVSVGIWLLNESLTWTQAVGVFTVLLGNSVIQCDKSNENT